MEIETNQKYAKNKIDVNMRGKENHCAKCLGDFSFLGNSLCKLISNQLYECENVIKYTDCF